MLRIKYLLGTVFPLRVVAISKFSGDLPVYWGVGRRDKALLVNAEHPGTATGRSAKARVANVGKLVNCSRDGCASVSGQTEPHQYRLDQLVDRALILSIEETVPTFRILVSVGRAYRMTGSKTVPQKRLLSSFGILPFERLLFPLFSHHPALSNLHCVYVSFIAAFFQRT